MCDYCGDMDRKHEVKRNQLKDGALGRYIYQYFVDNGYEALPVRADYLEGIGTNEISYRMTFDDETVADCKILFDSIHENEILSVEEYNRVT